MGGKRIVLTLALLACVALLATWALLREEPARVPAPAASVESTTAIPVPAPVQAPPPLSSATDAGPESPKAADDRALGTLRGRVVDAFTQGPIREFELQFHGGSAGQAGGENPGRRTFRSHDGRFEWAQVMPGTWTVTASARGYQRFTLEDLQITAGAATADMTLPLRAGRTVRGRVYDEATGDGIAAATLSYREASAGRFEGNWRIRPRVTSAQDGSFLLDGVPAVRIILDASAQGYAQRQMEIVVGEITPPLEVGLSSGGSIAGRLTAADGVTAVSGAIGLSNLDEHYGGTHRTGKRGEFSFQHLASGRYRVTGQSGGAVASRDFTLAPNQRIEGIVLALQEGRSIRGVVSGLRPEDLKRVSISLRREVGEFGYGEVGVDERGAYALSGVQPGPVLVVADVSMRRQLSKAVQVPVATDITVDLEFPPGATLSGRVTRGGKPLPNVWIEPRPVEEQRRTGSQLYVYGTSTSVEGLYAIEDLAPGEYTLWAGEYRSRPVQVAGDTVFDIDVPLAQIAGRVVEAGKVPVVGAEVDALPVDATAKRARVRTRSDDFGQFALVGLEPGDFLLTVYKPQYQMYRERISYSSPVADMTVGLRPDAGIEVRLSDAISSTPLQRVLVSEMINGRNAATLFLRLDPQGVGYIPGALAGSMLVFSASGYSPTVIPAWEGQPLEIRLRPQAADE